MNLSFFSFVVLMVRIPLLLFVVVVMVVLLLYTGGSNSYGGADGCLNGTSGIV